MPSPVRTFKRTTIFISRGEETWVYDSPEAIPALLRKQLLRSTRGMNSATILIADRGGREEIRKLLEGQPSALDEGLRIVAKPALDCPSQGLPTADVNREPLLVVPASGSLRVEDWLEGIVPFLLAAAFALLLMLR